MLALTLWAGAAAHAAEAFQCLDAPSAQAAAHFEGDGDEGPGDSQNGAPHHHGSCSGHCLAMLNGGKSTAAFSPLVADVTPGISDALGATEPDPSLRPPIA